MFKRISAVVMVLVMAAMLSMTAFAAVDRDAVEKKLVEHLFTEVGMDCDDEGYHIPVEDNPTSTLYYSFYIKPFVEESSDELLDNIDLTDETGNSINKFVRFWYSDWESEQPDMIDYLMNDGNTYRYVSEDEDNWIIKDSDGKELKIAIEKTDESFEFSIDDKKLGSYDRLFQYSYLNDEEEIAYDQDVKDGKIDEFAFDYGSDEEYSEDVEEDYEDDAEINHQPAVTPAIVSEVDNAKDTEIDVSDEEINVEEAPGNNTPIIVGGLALVAVAAAGFVYFKKKKEN